MVRNVRYKVNEEKREFERALESLRESDVVLESLERVRDS